MGEKFDIAKEKLKTTLTDTPSKDKTINAFKGGISAYEGYTLLLPVLEKVIVAKRNKNMDKAVILFNEGWARIAQRTKLTKMIPESEIRKFINSRDNLNVFCSKLHSMKRYFKKVNNGIDIGSKIVNISSNLSSMYLNHIGRNEFGRCKSKVQRMREEFVYAQRQMSLVMGITAELASFAPPGMKEYLEYNLNAFNACQKGFELVNKHAQKIEKLSQEVENLWLEVQSNMNNKVNIMLSLSKNTRKNSSELSTLGIQSYKRK